MRRQPWRFKCPVCEYEEVKVYTAREDRSAFVVCGLCRTLVKIESPRFREPIDLYNQFCDMVRPHMGSYVKTIFEDVPQPSQRQVAKTSPPRVAGGTVVFAAPLCTVHEFVTGETVRGFQAEILAQTRICVRCGHAEREAV